MVARRSHWPCPRGIRSNRRHANHARPSPAHGQRSAGPSLMRQLEPPGFLALNYGYQTPISVIVAHTVFGAILGAFYRFP